MQRCLPEALKSGKKCKCNAAMIWCKKILNGGRKKKIRSALRSEGKFRGGWEARTDLEILNTFLTLNPNPIVEIPSYCRSLLPQSQKPQR